MFFTKRNIPFVRNLLLSVSYYLSFICFACGIAALGPTLLWLAQRTGSDIGQIGWIFTTRGLGSLSCSFICGKIYDALYHKFSLYGPHVYLVCNIILLAGIFFLIPWVTQLSVLLLITFFMGITFSNLNVGCNTMIGWCWKEKVTSFMLFMHFSFGIGTVVIPLFLGRFLDRLQVGYFGISAILLGCALIVASIQILVSALDRMLESPKLPTLEVQEELKDSSDTNVSVEENITEDVEPMLPQEETVPPTTISWKDYLRPTHSFWIALLTGVTLICAGSVEHIVHAFMYAYLLQTGISSSEEQAALMTSMFWLSFTVGRLGGSILASFVKPWMILVLCLLLEAIALLLWLFVPEQTVWIAIVVLGLGSSSTFPTVLSFPSSSFKGLQMTGGLTSLMIACAILGGTVSPTLTAQIVKKFGYPSMWKVAAVAYVLGATGISVLIGVSWKLGNNNK